MEIVIQYPIQILKWGQAPKEKFLGHLADYGCVCSLGITPEDLNEPECCYFNIHIEKKIVNESTKSLVFFAKTYSSFKVKNDYKKPTAEFFYKLLVKATADFSAEYYKNTFKTNLGHQKIPIPQFAFYKDDLEKT